jgi:hypothetical protein
MVAESIQYDSSFFEEVLSYPIYRTMNVVAVTHTLKELEGGNIQWVKAGEAPQEDDESQLERIGTNFWAMTFVLNRLNEILRFAQNKGNTIVDTDDGEISTDQIDFMTNHIGNKEGFEKEFKRFHQLLKHFGEYILQSGSKAFSEIIGILTKSTPIEISQNIFLKNIDQFFPRAIDIKAEGNFADAINCLDAIFNYRGNIVKVKIVPCQKIERDGDYWKVWADYHPEKDGIDFFIFTLPNQYVYVFEYVTSKFRDLSGDTLHDRTSQKGLSYLFHVETLATYKKVF